MSFFFIVDKIVSNNSQHLTALDMFLLGLGRRFRCIFIDFRRVHRKKEKPENDRLYISVLISENCILHN